MSLEEHEKQISKPLLDWVNGIGLLAAALVGIVSVFIEGKTAQQVAYGIAIAVGLGSVGYFLYRRWRARRTALPALPQALGPKAALRGLLPFEDGDDLPGRAQDVQQLYTLASGSDFRFGALCGESGCGKTSLLRAGLVPRLREKGYLPLYMPKPTGDPTRAIRAALQRAFPEMQARTDRALGDLLIEAAATCENNQIVILLDQFEEFFLLNRSPDARASFGAWLGETIADLGLPVAILLCLREDFALKLFDLGNGIQEPILRQTTHYLRNLHADQARGILAEAARADGLNFEPGLIQAVVDDLAVEGIVRPAELQIVGTSVKSRGLTRLNRYEAVGRARGILASYIGDEIARHPNQQAARLVLRALCAPTGEARSPEDRSVQQIVDSIAGPAGAREGRPEVRATEVQQILDGFVAARILLRTEAGCYNLVHDYLAPHVFAATRGVETNTERADRLLLRYLAFYRDDRRTRMPFRICRLVSRHASARLKRVREAQLLLSRSRRATALTALGVIGVPLILLSLYGYLFTLYYWDYGRIYRGHPNWAFLPGLGDLVVDVSEPFGPSTRIIEKGTWLRKPYGYHMWADQLLETKVGTDRVRLLYLLDQPERARGALPTVDVLDEASSSYVYESPYAETAILYPEDVPLPSDKDLVAVIKTHADSSYAGALAQNVQLLELTALSESNPSAVTPQVIQSIVHWSLSNSSRQLDQLEPLSWINPHAFTQETFADVSAKAGNSQVGAWQRSAAMVTLSQLAQVAPHSVSIQPGQVESLVAVVTDPMIAPFYRSQAASAIERLAASGAPLPSASTARALRATVLDVADQASARLAAASALAQIEFSYDLAGEIDSELMLAVLDAALEYDTYDSVDPLPLLARVNPRAFTPACMAKLDAALDTPQSQSCAVYLLQALIDAGIPAEIPWRVLHNLTLIIANPNVGNSIASAAAEALVELVQRSPDALPPDTVRGLFSMVVSPDFPYDRRLWAATLVATATRTQSESSEREVLEARIHELVERQQPDKWSHITSGVDAQRALEALANAMPEVVTPALIEQLVKPGHFIWPMPADTGYWGIDTLCRLVEQVPASLTESSVSILLGYLEEESRDDREVGATACACVAYLAPDVRAPIEGRAVALQDDPRPHVRIAASQVLEALRVVDLQEALYAHPERLVEVKIKLALLAQSQSYHIRFAARLAQGRVDAYERTIQ